MCKLTTAPIKSGKLNICTSLFVRQHELSSWQLVFIYFLHTFLKTLSFHNQAFTGVYVPKLQFHEYLSLYTGQM